jgi:hypothetical protein
MKQRTLSAPVSISASTNEFNLWSPAGSATAIDLPIGEALRGFGPTVACACM